MKIEVGKKYQFSNSEWTREIVDIDNGIVLYKIIIEGSWVENNKMPIEKFIERISIDDKN